MKQKLPSEELQSELSWEEAVARYLEDHPDYFQRYPETLSRILLSHETGGKAVSLIERQVQVLRGQNQALLRQEFKLDAVVILLRGRPTQGGRAELVPEDDKRLNTLFQQFSSGKPIC